MNKYITYSVVSILLIISHSLHAQEIVSREKTLASKMSLPTPPIILDTATICCKYRQSVVNDTLNQKSSNSMNIMLLQIGKNISKYFDLKLMISDSIMFASIKEGLDNETIISKTQPAMKGSKNERLFKDYPKGKITTISFLMGSYLFEEEYISPQWKLLPDTLTILGYSCKKAIAPFRGRNYTAWYTPKIPINNGPWKFSGLPGLILKAEDDEKQISFECISIEKANSAIQIDMPNRNYMKTTKTAFVKLEKSYMENPSAIIQPMMQTQLPASAKRKRPYNPIELSE